MEKLNRCLRPGPTRAGRASGLWVSRSVNVFTVSWMLGSGAIAIADGEGTAETDGRWKPQGPAPIRGAQVDIPPSNEASGAIHAVAAHPRDPDILYVGSVNGGIWRTRNAMNPSPKWKLQTADLESQSISEIEFDPTDRRARTLVAGFGATSSLGGIADDLPGLAITANAGDKWSVIGREMAGATITGVAPRGKMIVAAARSTRLSEFPVPLGPVDGIWRSRNGGRSFKKLSGAGTGLPEGSAYDLVGDPLDPKVLYAAIVFSANETNGIYKSVDTGATWNRVSDDALNTAINATPPGPANLELAVGSNDNIFVSVVGSSSNSASLGALSALFRSGDGGATWASLDLPSTQEEGAAFGIHVGLQGATHNSIAADPQLPYIVYLGGDRQPAYTEPNFTPPFFPNSIGAMSFSARLFRCDASKPAGQQCVHLTDCAAKSDSPNCSDPRIVPTAGGGVHNDSAPHADSRHMIFDAADNLVVVDVGGIYRLISPANNSGAWTSVNGNLAINEQHSQAFDTVAAVNLAGSQDNGVNYQVTPGQADEWAQWMGGDGGDVAVDPSGFPHTGQGFSARFSSAQSLGNFSVSFWDTDNQLQGFVVLPLTPLDGTPGPLTTAQFYTPIATNAVEEGRLVVAASDGVYESLDGGATATRVGEVQALGSGRDPLAYGARDNPDILYVGGGQPGTEAFDEVYVRTGPPGAKLARSTRFPGRGSGQSIRGITVNPNDSHEAFVINNDSVFWTRNAGATWETVTGKLTGDTVDDDDDDDSRRAGTPLRSILFIPDPSRGSGDESLQGRLVVGANNGVFVAEVRRRGRLNWRSFGFGLPRTQVHNLQYDADRNAVYAGTIANGSWRIKLRRR